VGGGGFWGRGSAGSEDDGGQDQNGYK
jgi:hypothetical protein